MAAIDYGAMVFLNGRRIYANQLYPEVVFADLKIVCYKHWCEISIGGELALDLYGVYERKDGVSMFDLPRNRISAHYRIGDKYMIHVKEVTPGVQRLKVSHDGMHLTILYGYGIDNNPKVWDKTKVLYLGKCRAKIVDKELAKAARPFCRHRQNDNGESE